MPNFQIAKDYSLLRLRDPFLNVPDWLKKKNLFELLIVIDLKVVEVVNDLKMANLLKHPS